MNIKKFTWDNKAKSLSEDKPSGSEPEEDGQEKDGKANGNV